MTIAEQILEELKMLNAAIGKLGATLAMPRPTRAEYAAQQKAEKVRRFVANAWRDEYTRRESEKL